MSKERTFKAGDRVQLREEDEETLFGEIVSLRSTEEDGETVNYATVQWDNEDGTAEHEVDLLEAEGEKSELEEEFEKVANSHMDEIKKQVEIATAALDKAVEISEKYGLPFYADVSPLSQSYTPGSFYSEFSELDHEFVYNLTDTYPGGEYDNEGWEHSAVC